MILIIAGGVISVFTIKQEVFPEFSADIVTVTVPYPGAAPEEVEEGVVIRIEEAIQDLEGIEEIRSTAGENVGSVLVEAMAGADVQKLLNDVKSRVDAIDTFPDEAEKPIVEEAIIRRQVMEVAISGDADERTLKRLGERVRDDLTALPGITQVELLVTRPYEISIEVSESDLRRYGLSFGQVAEAVRRASLDLPGGADQHRGQRDPAAHRGPGLHRPRVRAPAADHPAGRHAHHVGRRRAGRRRLRRHRPVGPLRRPAGGAGAGLPGRRAERPRGRGARSRPISKRRGRGCRTASP